MGPVFICTLLSQVAIAALGAFLSYLWLKLLGLPGIAWPFSPFGSSPGTAVAAP